MEARSEDRGQATCRSSDSGINSHWTTNLQVGGLADAPRFTGRAELVRGDYDFAGRNFRLDRGTIRFRGESPLDPQLDIRASAQVQGLDANVLVQGTGLKPEITFASTPPLPQDELLSRILFGTSITNLSAPEALQLASAVAALQSGSGSLDPINALAKGDRARPSAHRARGHCDGTENGDRRGQVHHAQIVRRSGDRRTGLFGDAGRISDDSLAFAAVDGLDGGPVERERAGQQGLLSECPLLVESGITDLQASAHINKRRPLERV